MQYLQTFFPISNFKAVWFYFFNFYACSNSFCYEYSIKKIFTLCDYI